MTHRVLTLEEQKAEAAIERRRAGFIARMLRVAEPGRGGEEDTCECCGYPYLYYDIDFQESCVVCGWGPTWDDDPKDTQVADGHSLPSLTQARVNFESAGWCLAEADRWNIGEAGEDARRQLVAALDALLADNDPESDQEHWATIRARFNTLVSFVWPRPGRRLRFVWGFARKVNGRL